MREPAWNKRISICSFSHAAILNVWSSHCPLAISPRQRRTRNHQPVPTLTLKVDSERRRRSRYHVAIKHTQRSASCPCRRHGGHFSDSKAARRAARRTSGTSAAPGGCTAGGSCPRPATRHLPLAPPPRTSPRRVWRRRHRAQQRPGSPPRRGRRHRHTASRRSNSRVLPARPHRPPPQDMGRQDMGQRSGRSSLRRQRNGWEVEAGQVLPSPRCANVRDDSPKSRTVRATAGRAAAGSIRSYRAGPGQIGPAGPGNATGNLQPNRCRPHLAQ